MSLLLSVEVGMEAGKGLESDIVTKQMTGEGGTSVYVEIGQFIDQKMRLFRLAKTEKNLGIGNIGFFEDYVIQIKDGGRWKTLQKFNNMESIVCGLFIQVFEAYIRMKEQLLEKPKRQSRRQVCKVCGCNHNVRIIKSLY